MGLESFVTLSNGEQIKCPQFLRNSESGLKRIQRAVARKKKSSQNREKNICRLQKKHLKIKRQRQDFLHKTTNNLIERFDEIAVEQLGIRKMIKSHHFAKSIADASWDTFYKCLITKLKMLVKKFARWILTELVKLAFVVKRSKKICRFDTINVLNVAYQCIVILLQRK